jgi:hypothetical protein
MPPVGMEGGRATRGGTVPCPIIGDVFRPSRAIDRPPSSEIQKAQRIRVSRAMSQYKHLLKPCQRHRGNPSRRSSRSVCSAMAGGESPQGIRRPSHRGMIRLVFEGIGNYNSCVAQPDSKPISVPPGFYRCRGDIRVPPALSIESVLRKVRRHPPCRKPGGIVQSEAI